MNIMAFLRNILPSRQSVVANPVPQEPQPQAPVVIQTTPAVVKEHIPMANPFIQFFGWLKHFFTRPGLVTFLDKYKFIVAHIIQAEIAKLPDGHTFNDIYTNVWALVKAEVEKLEGNPVPGNWISGLIFIGFEFIKGATAPQN